MAKNEQTSKSVAGKASKLMRTSKSKNVRSVAASALTQAPSKKKKK
jgi:stage V sporulation protein SpoVS